MTAPRRILISRTDGIGDVVLTLPVAAYIKKHLPGSVVLFLGTSYTKPVIEACRHVDGCVEWDRLSGMDNASRIQAIQGLNADAILHVFPDKRIARLARRARIPLRIGTRNRLFHLLTCNRLVALSRKNSPLHEAQLNLALLAPLGIRETPSLHELRDAFGVTKLKPLRPELKSLIVPGMHAAILHPRSKGSAREWGLDRFSELVALLPAGKFQVFVTGTSSEGESMREFLDLHRSRITDLTGRLSVEELLSFIAACDSLVAASTGPLHIAAALGKIAVGIYAPLKPIWPRRWAPLGKGAHALVAGKDCSACRHGGACECMRSISPKSVADILVTAAGAGIAKGA
jgi:heptosyltransferase-3